MDCNNDAEMIDMFNTHLISNCGVDYKIKCVKMNAGEVSKIQSFAAESKCHDVLGVNVGIPYALVLTHNDKYISYLSYSESRSNFTDEVKDWCDFETPKKGLAIEYMCTSKEYRKQGLMQLLALVFITLAKRSGYDVVVAATNAGSAHVLKKYFGFQIDKSNPNTTFLHELCSFNFSLEINAKLELADTKQFEKTYKKFVMCSSTGRMTF
jgi:GNAT superfamily N-acetyltransferase